MIKITNGTSISSLANVWLASAIVNRTLYLYIKLSRRQNELVEGAYAPAPAEGGGAETGCGIFGNIENL